MGGTVNTSAFTLSRKLRKRTESGASRCRYSGGSGLSFHSSHIADKSSNTRKYCKTLHSLAVRGFALGLMKPEIAAKTFLIGGLLAIGAAFLNSKINP